MLSLEWLIASTIMNTEYISDLREKCWSTSRRVEYEYQFALRVSNRLRHCTEDRKWNDYQLVTVDLLRHC